METDVDSVCFWRVQGLDAEMRRALLLHYSSQTFVTMLLPMPALVFVTMLFPMPASVHRVYHLVTTAIHEGALCIINKQRNLCWVAASAH
eukprot:937169-Pelagomonas_calceolata.AAC.9